MRCAAGRRRSSSAPAASSRTGRTLAGGKHNFVLQTVLPYIARAIGNSLIAPIVKFVPEGAHRADAGGHMAYPGTISLEPATFEALLTDICRSYKAHGFKDIILLGDSGGNQAGMRNVADALNKKWAAETARVHFLREYYDRGSVELRLPEDAGHHPDRQDAAAGQAADRRTDTRNGMHDDIYYEAQTAVQDPKLIRAEQRMKAGLFTLHGVDLAPVSRTVELGRKLAVYRADHGEGVRSIQTPPVTSRSRIQLRAARQGDLAAGPRPDQRWENPLGPAR